MEAKFAYTGIRVRDMDRAIAFYTGVLGMKLTGRQRIEVAGGEVANLVSEEGGHELELNCYDRGSKFDTPYTPGEGLDHLAFSVPDLDRAEEELKRLGHRVVEVLDTGKSRWFYIEDPDGNYIEFLG